MTDPEAKRPPILAWPKVPERPDEPIADYSRGKVVTMQFRRNPYDGRVTDHILMDQKHWATVLAVTTDGLVPAVREYKQGRDSVGIELPAGTPNYSDKTPEQVAHDQLLVETGYEAGEVVYLGFTWMATRNSRTQIHHFLAMNCRQVRPNAAWDKREPIEKLMMTLLEWITLTYGTKEIEEHSAIVASHRAEPHLIEAGLLNMSELRRAQRGGNHAQPVTGMLASSHPKMDDERRRIREVDSTSHDFATTLFDVHAALPLGNHLHWRKEETFTIMPADWQPTNDAGHGVVVLQQFDRKMQPIEVPREITITPGMVVHIPAGCAHTFVLTPGTRMHCHNGSCFHSSDMPAVMLVLPDDAVALLSKARRTN